MDWDRYVAAWAERDGGYDPRRAPAPVRGWLRGGYEIARGLQAARVPPATLTVLGLGLAALVPLLADRGPAGLWLAAGLVLLGNLASLLARALDLLAAGSSRSEPGFDSGSEPGFDSGTAPGFAAGSVPGFALRGRGAARRAIGRTAVDRLAELAWLAGFWIAGAPGPLVATCGALTGLHELVREQALAAGASRLGAQTVADRPMRVSVAVTGLALAGLAGAAGGRLGSGVLTVAAAVWLLLALIGAGQLAAAIDKSLP